MNLKVSIPILFLFFTFCLSFTNALYTASDNVIDLNDQNFETRVLKSDAVWVVEFYAPWCGHCKNLVPEYKKLANYASGLFQVGAVDGTQSQSLASKYKIQGFPTIKVFVGKRAIDYNGERTAAAIADFAMQQAQKELKSRVSGKSSSKSSSSSSSSKDDANHVITLTDANFEELVLKSNDLWMVEFFAPWCGHCKKLEPHYKRAAAKLHPRIKLGAVDATVYGDLANKYHVQGYPTLKVFVPGKKDQPQDYSGGRTTSDIVTYMEQIPGAPLEFKEVIEINSQEEFDQTCGERTCIIAVLPHILDSGANLRNQYINFLKAGTLLQTNSPFRYAWVEAGSQPSLELAVSAGDGFSFYPALAAYSHSKQRCAVYRGTYNPDGIANFINGLPSGRERTIKTNVVPQIQSTTKWDGKDAQPPHSDDL
jgi:protein disulfide-isomerase A6